MFHLNVQDDNDDVTNHVGHTRQYKYTVRSRLTILMSFCSKFIRVYVCQ